MKLLVENNQSLFQKLSWMGITRDEFNQVLLKYKPQIMKYLLTLMVQHDFFLVKRRIYFLKNAGQNWDELDIIQHSIDHDLDKSDLLESRIEQVTDRIKSLFDNQKVHKAIYELAIQATAYDLPLEFVKQILTEYKPVIIRYLLQSLSNSELEYDTMVVLDIIQDLHFLGCDWSELKIIKTSIEVDNKRKLKLKEAMNPAQWKLHQEQEMIKRVSQDPWTITNISKPSEAVQLAAVNANGLVFRELEDPSDQVKVAALNQIKNNKPVIIKFLLKSIRDDLDTPNQIDDLIGDLKFLKDNKIEWPELRVITRSLLAHIESKGNRLRESTDDVRWNQLVRNFDHQLKVCKDNHFIVHTYFMFALVELCTGVYKKQAARLMEANKETLITILAKNLNQELTSKYGTVRDAIFPIALLYTSNQWSELSPMVTDKKSIIIRHLLLDLKDGNISDAFNALRYLAELNIHWEELAIIRNSVDADIKRTHELTGRDPEEIDESDTPRRNGSLAIGFFELDDVYQGVRFTYSELQTQKITKYTAEYILEEYKTPIIKYLLSLFAANANIEHVWCNQTLTILERMNVNWDELKIIRKSLDAILPTLKETTSSTRVTPAEQAARELEPDLSNLHSILALLMFCKENNNISQEDIDKFLLDRKPTIIKYLLTKTWEAFQRGYSPTIVYRNIAILSHELNQHWPELDSICRSIEHENSLGK